MDPQAAADFAAEWEAAWNGHDLDALLAHVSDEVVFTSPLARTVVPGSDGVCRGKEALRGYWGAGLVLIPDLHFTVVAVYAGVDTVVINYRNHRDTLVCEVLRFVDGLVVEGGGTYLVDAVGSAG